MIFTTYSSKVLNWFTINLQLFLALQGQESLKYPVLSLKSSDL